MDTNAVIDMAELNLLSASEAPDISLGELPDQMESLLADEAVIEWLRGLEDSVPREFSRD